MPNFRRFRSYRGLLGFAWISAMLFGLAMLHPYPRQSLFGPTFRGEPWCVWDAQVRRHVHREEFEKSMYAKSLRWLGIKLRETSQEEVFENAEMLPLLLELADDRDVEVRRAVLRAIRGNSEMREQALPLLRRKLRDEDSVCRIHAAWAIWTSAKDRAAIDVALHEAEDRTSQARRDALSLIGDACEDLPELFESILVYENDPDARVRVEVMYAMSAFGAKGLPILQRGLEDPYKRVRQTAATTLGDLGSGAKPALPALERRLGDSDFFVRCTVRRAIRLIDRDRFNQLTAAGKIEKAEPPACLD